jgi:hypothetical protein
MVQSSVCRELIAACQVAREVAQQLGGVPNLKRLLLRLDRQFLTKASSLGTGNRFGATFQPSLGSLSGVGFNHWERPDALILP